MSKTNSPLVTWSNCPVCGGTARTPWVEFSNLRFERCAGCGAVYKTIEAQNVRTSDFYEADYHTGKRSRRWLHRVRKAKRQLQSAMALGDCQAVLDIGCSVGYIIEAGRQLGLRSAGVDVSSFAVDQARQRGLEARVGTLERIPYADQEFDLVVMRHVLEHTPTPLAALAECRRVLRPGGMLLVLVPDLEYWKGTVLRRTYRYFRPDDLGRQHFVYYNSNSLSEVLSVGGFRVLATSKAVPTHTRMQKGPARLWAWLFFSVLAVLLKVIATARLRRELYFIAQKADGVAPG